MHQIHIPQNIVDRCIARRGRRYLYESLDPRRTALLVIDMQNCFVVPGLSPVEVPGVAAIAPNINRLAEALGRPERRYASLLVAGTNGKGSTAALLTSILRSAGYRTGRYTSPHIRRL